MDEQPHKRRVRYKGTHPRTFAEKYKERNPEKYQEEAEKIRSSGRTPAGTHVPIMVEEILSVLQIRPGETGYDATLGYGGHSRRMLEQLNGTGHLYATDVDPIESVKTQARLEAAGFGEERFTLRHMNFARIDEVAPDVKFDFVLADLGVSSMQLDNPERGFSYKLDGPLDLRLNPEAGISAAERLRELDLDSIISMLVENSDEPYAEKIAKEILRAESRSGIETTKQLAACVEQALSFLPAGERKDAVKQSNARVFQALRIDVNSEFESLYSFLEKLPGVMAPSGRIAILTFHSGEDRLVKQAFRQYVRDGVFADASKDVIRPSAEECFRNPRSKSTKLRWAVMA